MLTLDDIGRRIAIGNFQELNIIVKGDVDGSVEALSDSLIRLSTEQIQVNVIHKAVGQISESDVVWPQLQMPLLLDSKFVRRRLPDGKPNRKVSRFVCIQLFTIRLKM
jgi:hypothetical protein